MNALDTFEYSESLEGTQIISCPEHKISITILNYQNLIAYWRTHGKLPVLSLQCSHKSKITPNINNFWKFTLKFHDYLIIEWTGSTHAFSCAHSFLYSKWWKPKCFYLSNFHLLKTLINLSDAYQLQRNKTWVIRFVKIIFHIILKKAKSSSHLVTWHSETEVYLDIYF